MLIRNVELWQGEASPPMAASLRIAGEQIAELGALVPRPGERVIDGHSGLLLPGLHDHHIHLAALAAKRGSVVCGPPEISDAAMLADRLARQPGEGWIRGIGYHESVMGLPDAAALDALVPDRPLRIQHRGGRMWLLNGAALAALLARAAPPPGMEREGARLTGRLFDEDRWLRDTLAGTPPDFSTVCAELARLGMTGVTDMSPGNDGAMAAHFAREMARGALVQRVMLAGSLPLGEAAPEGWQPGPLKLHLHEAALPDPDAVAQTIRAARVQHRAAAFHCTTEVELVFALSVLRDIGRGPRQDRIEHAGICPDALLGQIADMRLAVISQPHFIAERGAQYLADVPEAEHAALYRLAGIARAGVTLAAGSDAPFGLPDPWAAMRAATTRATPSGAVIGADEALSPEAAVGLFLADPADLTRQRRLAPGQPADMVLLDRPWTRARARLASADVRATIIAGRVVHDGIDQPPLERHPR